MKLVPVSQITPARAAHLDSTSALVAKGLSMRTAQGPVFGPVDLVVPAGHHAAILGEQGSGRSAMLLALGGRLKGVSGQLTLGEVDGIAHPRKLRQRIAVARITDLVELEPTLTVGEARDEHSLLEGIGSRAGRVTFQELAGALDLELGLDRLVGDLPAVQRTLLSVVLGCLRPADFVLVDDVDDSLTRDQLADVYAAMDVLALRGHHFIVSALSTSPVPSGAATITLIPPESAERLALRFGHLRPRRTTIEAN